MDTRTRARSRPPLFIEASTHVDAASASGASWRRYLPDQGPPVRDPAKLRPWLGDFEVDGEPTGCADIRQIVSSYPDMAPEQLTPFGASEEEPRFSQVAATAILPSAPPVRPRLPRAALALGAASVLLAAGLTSLFLLLG